MTKRKKRQDGPASSWMTSYTDLVTVLFALFVMLYALSEVDEALWEEFARAAAIGPMAAAAPFDFERERDDKRRVVCAVVVV